MPCRSAGLRRPVAGVAGLQQSAHHVGASRRRQQQRAQLPGVQIRTQADDLHRRSLGQRQSEVIERVAQAGAHRMAQQSDAEVGERRQRTRQQQRTAVRGPRLGREVETSRHAGMAPRRRVEIGVIRGLRLRFLRHAGDRLRYHADLTHPPVCPILSSLRVFRRGVAQPGSAPALGAGGPQFKSGRPDTRR